MNVLHMKYALEVARLGSLNKAAESLLIAQPNLSRSVKELEAELGITIFTRSAKGMVLTPEGEEFIGYAGEILKQIDQVDKMYKEGAPKKQRFSISAPRAGYISEALAQFSKTLSADSVEVFYKETNTQKTIQNVLTNDFKLGIIRYGIDDDKYYKLMLEEKGLAYEMVTELSYCLVMSKESPLAGKENIKLDDLQDYIEISRADSDGPSLPTSKASKEELHNISRRIFVFDGAGQFDLLSENPQAFTWASPLPDKILKRYGLVQRKCQENKKIYKDVLIYREGYRLSEVDKQFITLLCDVKRQCMK